MPYTLKERAAREADYITCERLLFLVFDVHKPDAPVTLNQALQRLAIRRAMDTFGRTAPEPAIKQACARFGLLPVNIPRLREAVGLVRKPVTRQGRHVGWEWRWDNNRGGR